MTRKEKKTTWNSIDSQPIRFKVVFLGCTILIIVFSISFLKKYEVKGRSMSGTIEPGSHVVINRLFRTSFDRGDIVVLKMDGVLFVKRIYKTGRDTLEFNQMGILNKNRVIPHDKIYFTISRDSKNYRDACQIYSILLLRKPVSKLSVKDQVLDKENCRVVIPENYLFVLGDNYYESMDSRFWGFVNKDKILGKVVFTY